MAQSRQADRSAILSNVGDPGDPAQPRPLAVGDVRLGLGLARREFARLTGYSERAIAGWERGEQPSGPSCQRLQEVRALQEGLATVMPMEQIGDWMRAPNSAFGGLKPIEVVERGEIHRLWQMIFYLQSDVPS